MAAKKKPVKKKAPAKKRKVPAKRKAPKVLKHRNNKGQYKKGAVGRPVGTKNKTPSQLVSKILDIEGTLSLEGKGLLDCARQDPAWFFEKILAKVIPKNIDFSLGGKELSEIMVKWAK